MLETDSMDEVVSCREAACSEAPEAIACEEAAIWLEADDT
jgi:hypothetical protein